MNLLKWIWAPKFPAGLSKEYIEYAALAYPSNHTYKITQEKLLPKRKLKERYKQIRELLPSPLTSLVDVGCSKGFFVFAASEQASCSRSLGIDITDYDIHFCQQLKTYLKKSNTQFENLKLHELANRIDEFGGSFQTVLLLNIYQYLYFGSDRFADHYLDHQKIFQYLRTICHQRVIFSNRVNAADCQNEKWLALAGEKSKDYSEEKILEAASQFFHVNKIGYIGRYPLWTLDVI